MQKSLDAINSGGLTGQGINEGIVKKYLPDAHTDFIFAVIVEELGLIGTILILSVFIVIFYRLLKFIIESNDNFSRVAVFGLFLQISF